MTSEAVDPRNYPEPVAPPVPPFLWEGGPPRTRRYPNVLHSGFSGSEMKIARLVTVSGTNRLPHPSRVFCGRVDLHGPTVSQRFSSRFLRSGNEDRQAPQRFRYEPVAPPFPRFLREGGPPRTRRYPSVFHPGFSGPEMKIARLLSGFRYEPVAPPFPRFLREGGPSRTRRYPSVLHSGSQVRK
jgi:hypothetical protein